GGLRLFLERQFKIGAFQIGVFLCDRFQFHIGGSLDGRSRSGLFERSQTGFLFQRQLKFAAAAVRGVLERRQIKLAAVVFLGGCGLGFFRAFCLLAPLCVAGAFFVGSQLEADGFGVRLRMVLRGVHWLIHARRIEHAVRRFEVGKRSQFKLTAAFFDRFFFDRLLGGGRRFRRGLFTARRQSEQGDFRTRFGRLRWR